MSSNIDPTKPTSGIAFTADVRANFQAAKNEIEAMQVVDSSGDFLGLTGKVFLTQAEYDALSPPVSTIWYLVTA